MIATKTATLMVAMAVIGIVPVAAHAQEVNIEEIAAAISNQESLVAAETEQEQANVDNDENTVNNAVFATVGAGGTFDAINTNAIDDTDSLTNGQEATTAATGVQTSAPTVTATQQPTLTVGEVLALLPNGGG
jgi:hypothetical protein